MEQPKYILDTKTRVRTVATLGDKGGFLISERHMTQRKPNAIGLIVGIVGGHGGDVYYVAHIDTPASAAYGFWEFELEPAKVPCQACTGTGMDWTASEEKKHWTPCPHCGGTAEYVEPRPQVSAYEHLKRNVLEIK